MVSGKTDHVSQTPIVKVGHRYEKQSYLNIKVEEEEVEMIYTKAQIIIFTIF
jgi:hypothetical protein